MAGKANLAGVTLWMGFRHFFETPLAHEVTAPQTLPLLFEASLHWKLRVLQDKVNEAYFLFSIAHKVTIGFAVIGVINGVFMQALLTE